MSNGGKDTPDQDTPDQKTPDGVYHPHSGHYRRPSALGSDVGVGGAARPTTNTTTKPGSPYDIDLDRLTWPGQGGPPLESPSTSINTPSSTLPSSKPTLESTVEATPETIPGATDTSSGKSADESRRARRIRWAKWLALPVMALLLIGGFGLAKSGGPDTATQPTPITRTVPDFLHGSQPATAPLRAAFDRTYGTFAPVFWSGSDNGKLQLPPGAQQGVLVYTGNGSSVAWRALDASGQVVQAGYQLTRDRSMDLLMGDRGIPDRLELEAIGAWTVEFWPLSSLPALPTTEVRSSSDSRALQCYLHDGPGGQAELHYGGSGLVSFEQHTIKGTGQLLSIAGEVTAKRNFEGGPTIVCVDLHQGPWKITPPA